MVRVEVLGGGDLRCDITAPGGVAFGAARVCVTSTRALCVEPTESTSTVYDAPPTHGVAACVSSTPANPEHSPRHLSGLSGRVLIHAREPVPLDWPGTTGAGYWPPYYFTRAPRTYFWCAVKTTTWQMTIPCSASGRRCARRPPTRQDARVASPKSGQQGQPHRLGQRLSGTARQCAQP